MPVLAVNPDICFKEDHDGVLYTAWKDSFAATELETCDFLYGWVRLCQPELVVETGTHLGHGAAALAKACIDNGRGRVVSCEIHEPWYEMTKKYLSSLDRVEVRLQSSLDLQELRQADLVFSDSAWDTRAQEYELVKPGCVFIVHDTFEPQVADFVRRNSGLILNYGRGCGILVKGGPPNGDVR